MPSTSANRAEIACGVVCALTKFALDKRTSEATTLNRLLKFPRSAFAFPSFILPPFTPQGRRENSLSYQES